MESGHHNKHKSTIDSEPSKKMKYYHLSTIEHVCLRFPMLEEKILLEVDSQTLIDFTTASKEMADIPQRA